MSPTSYQTAPPRSKGRYSIKILHLQQANIVFYQTPFAIEPNNPLFTGFSIKNRAFTVRATTRLMWVF